MNADGHVRRWRLPAALLVGAYLLLLGWLATVALVPGLDQTAPAWLGWLATPRSAGAMAAALVLSGVAFAALLASRGQALGRTPTLLSGWCAASAAPLAMSSYLPCTGQAPPFWTAVTSTLSLFLGSFDTPFGAGQACEYPVPLALQLARLLAIVATLSGATSVLFAVSRSQLDRFGTLRARRLTVVAGLDETSWPVLQQVARNREAGHRTVLLTSDVGNLVERARAGGVLVLRTATDDPLGLRELPWHKVGRCYLLSADAGVNRARAMLLREAPQTRRDGTAAAPGPPRKATSGRLTVVARIDDPWHADDWRKRFIGAPGFVFDAIGVNEATAEALVDRLRTLPGVDELILSGEAPLLLALCAELSQQGRELQFLDETAGLPGVTLLDQDARAIAADHQVRQQRFASDPLVVAAVDTVPTLDSLQAALDRVATAGHRAAVVVARAGTRLGTRLAVRHPDLPVFELADGSRPVLADEPAAGRLSTFNLALTDATGRSANAWERAARAVHERYRRRFPDAGLAIPWEELPREFYRESNRRQLHSILDAMAALGRSWAASSPEPQPGPDPERLAAATTDERIDAGRAFFDLTETELSAVAELEHDSWRRQYQADGWRLGPVRDDSHQQHPDLKPWADLGTEARRRTMAGVVDTLFALRALGYRSVPVAVPDQWAELERVGEVRAERLDRPLSWLSSGGDRLTGEPGDWLVRDSSGGERTVTDASFRAGHRHLAGDRYQRTGRVRARRAHDGETVATQEGPVASGPDSWVVQDDAGNRWVVPDGHLRAGYRPVSQA